MRSRQLSFTKNTRTKENHHKRITETTPFSVHAFFASTQFFLHKSFNEFCIFTVLSYYNFSLR